MDWTQLDWNGLDTMELTMVTCWPQVGGRESVDGAVTPSLEMGSEQNQGHQPSTSESLPLRKQLLQLRYWIGAKATNHHIICIDLSLTLALLSTFLVEMRLSS